MEGLHIKLDVGEDTPERSEDGGFADALNFFRNGSVAQEKDSQLATQLSEIQRSESRGKEGKKKIISDALYLHGLDWGSLKNIRENKEALEAFGQMLAHWDSPKDEKPKTQEDHISEAEEFAKLLK